MSNIRNNQVIIFGGDNYNTLGMIRTLGERHISFYSIIIKGSMWVASKSKYLNKKNSCVVKSIEEGYTILLNKKDDCTKQKKFLLVEGDDLTGFLDRNYSQLKDYFIWNNAGEELRLSYFLNKQNQIELVKKYGINVLPSVVVSVGEIPINLEYPVITKAVTSEVENWKSEVYVCYTEEELKEAYKKIKSKKIVLQKYIKKKKNELCLDGYSVDGGSKQFVAIASTYNYILEAGYSFFGTATNFNDKELEEKIANIMSEVKFEGIYSFEFIIDENDIPYFLEINFRNSGWSYASTCAGMPLPILWMESMMSQEVDEKKKANIPNGFTFINDFADFKARAGKSISFIQWFKEYRNTNCKLVMGKNDVVPFWAYLFSRIIYSLKKRCNRNENN